MQISCLYLLLITDRNDSDHPDLDESTRESYDKNPEIVWRPYQALRLDRNYSDQLFFQDLTKNSSC